MRKFVTATKIGLLLAASVLTANPARAVDSTTANLDVKLEITPGCSIGFGDGSNGQSGQVDFGKFINLDSDLTAQINVNVRCSKSTPPINYKVSMSEGGAGTYTPARKMKNPSGQTIDYNIYSDSNYRQVWGTKGSDIVAGSTFTKGADKDTHAVYLKVPAQKDKALSTGVYTDTVVATVTY